MLRFYLPLAWTSMLMMVTHVFVAAGIARTNDPKLALAGLALAQGVSVFLEAPMVTARQAAIALVRDPASFRLVTRISLIVLIVVTAAAAIIAFTPVGRLVFFALLGAPAAVAAHGWQISAYYILVPAASLARSLAHAVAILCRQTKWVFLGMLVRVAVVAGVVALLAGSRWVPGGALGAVGIGAGIATEALICWIAVPELLSGLRRDPPARPPQSAAVWRFFTPLVAAGLIANLGKPFLNAGLARAADATVALAGLAVAQSAAWILIAPMQNLHQVVLVYEAGGGPKASRFAAGVAAVGFLSVAALGFTPLGDWVFQTVIGVGPDVGSAALGATRWLSLLPPLLAWQEVAVGRLLLQRRGKAVTGAKVVNVAALGAAIAALVALARSGWALPGYAVAVLAMAIGHAAEAALATALVAKSKPAVSRPAQGLAG